MARVDIETTQDSKSSLERRMSGREKSSLERCMGIVSSMETNIL